MVGPAVPVSVHRTARLAPKCLAGRQRVAAKQTLQTFSGMRRLNAVDAVAMPQRAATLQARSKGAAGRGTRQTTRAMFERFTEKAIKVVMLAQEEARRLGELLA